jgi:hypothetical protein
MLVPAAVLTLLAALAVGSQVQTPAQRAANAAAPPPSVITAEVEQSVVTSGFTTRARLRPQYLTAVGYPGGTGASRAVVSGLPKRPGAPIRAGEVCAVVSGRPLIVLAGAVQSYRDLSYGARGQDVDQLRSALAALGFRIGDPRGSYGLRTAAAVRQLYARSGFEPPRNPALDAEGVDDPEQTVRATRRALDSARRRATAAARALDQARRDLSAIRAAAGPAGPLTRAAEAAYLAAQDADAEARAAIADAQDAYDRATDRRRLLEPGMYLPMAEAVFVPRLPARVVDVSARLGEPATGDLLRIGSGAVRAGGPLTREQAPAVRAGLAAELELPDGTRVAGRVVGVEAVTPDDPPEGGDQATAAPEKAAVTVVAEFGRGLPGTAAADEVPLRITTKASPAGSLVVPVAAINTDAGASWIRVVAGSRVTNVPVRIGLVADGRAAVTAAGLAAGDRVVVGEHR